VVIGVALVSGVLVVAGLLVAVSGLRRAPQRERAARRPRRRIEVPAPGRVALVCGSALVMLVFTRWPVGAIAVGVAAAYATSPVFRRQVADAEKAEALTTWAEMLRDATGTPRGIEGVLVATASGAPELIRPHVTALARRLPYEPLDSALDTLADDLDHPVGDLVVSALRLSARSGGRQIRAVLDDLATVARDEARMHRRIEVARARPRSEMRSVLVVMGAFVVLFLVFANEYLEPYGTPAGQLALGVVAACWGTAVWVMARMGRSEGSERFLAREGAP
jgi:Flp pilus assembly protein TadB